MQESTVTSVTKTAVYPVGMAEFTAMVAYPGEPVYRIKFTGHPGHTDSPVIMETPSAGQIFVRNPGRLGEFGKSWVLRFFE